MPSAAAVDMTKVRTKPNAANEKVLDRLCPDAVSFSGHRILPSAQ
jgi:hypothetical protein